MSGPCLCGDPGCGRAQRLADLDTLIGYGFDRSRARKDGSLMAGCSQCAAAVICGVPCHEKGCPNETHECEECHARVPKHIRLCEGCADDAAEGLL